MRVFKTKEFARFCRRESLSDKSLCEAVERAERGLIDADLGSGLIKQRIPREGQGRRGGYRTLMAFCSQDRTVFVYGFAKSERDNIKGDNWIFGDVLRVRFSCSMNSGFRHCLIMEKRRRFVAMTELKYRSYRLEALHKTASALHGVGAMDKMTMRDLDAFCLTSVETLSGEDIQALRLRERVSQAVLAHHLNVRTKLVSDWERGVKKPSGPSLKLLSLVRSKGLEAIA